ncbi:MAG: hypothetical protein C4547_03180 [Phycisphaerales bacterium]|nr:MAG: hypothetical protein C4547_03180 [Phycisphaerales bacterium]
MPTQPDSLVASEPLPRDFIALSRTILHLANLGSRRFEFLRDVSRILLHFSRCDRLDVWLQNPDFTFRWAAEAGPPERFGYDPQGAHECAAVGRLVEAVSRGELDRAAPCMTRHGSFWTGDLTGVLRALDISVEAGGADLASMRSVLIVPFDLNTADRGTLLLGSAAADFFSAESIELFESVAQTLALAIADRRAQASLRERVKELGCLYQISQINADTDQPEEARLQRIVERLPAAWQYPESAVARIELRGRVYETGPVAGAAHRMEAPIVIGGKPCGRVEVAYRSHRPEFVTSPFLPEERSLIDGIAGQIAQSVERSELRRQREQLEVRLRHADRLSLIGQLAAGIAHEINEPLGGILGFAQLLRGSPAIPEGQRKDIDKIVTASLHAREIVRKLILFARPEPMKTAEVDVQRVVGEALSMVEARCAAAGVRIVRSSEAAAPAIRGDGVQLRQVVLNLAINAVQAMPRGGVLTVSIAGQGGDVILTVTDTGVGMDEQAQANLFTPFYTTKDVGEGTGLGLSVVHGIVTAHGGTITVQSTPGEGTEMTVRFPGAGRGPEPPP